MAQTKTIAHHPLSDYPADRWPMGCEVYYEGGQGWVIDYHPELPPDALTLAVHLAVWAHWTGLDEAEGEWKIEPVWRTFAGLPPALCYFVITPIRDGRPDKGSK